MAREMAALQCGEYSANSIAFDRSGKTIAVGSDDCLIRMINYEGELPKEDSTLKNHNDAIQSLAFDHNSRTLISGASDCEFKLWN